MPNQNSDQIVIFLPIKQMVKIQNITQIVMSLKRITTIQPDSNIFQMNIIEISDFG